MQPNSTSFATPGGPDAFPRCGEGPILLADERSHVLTCVVEAGRTYRVGINTPPSRNLVSTAGVPAAPAEASFSVR